MYALPYYDLRQVLGSSKHHGFCTTASLSELQQLHLRGSSTALSELQRGWMLLRGSAYVLLQVAVPACRKADRLCQDPEYAQHCASYVGVHELKPLPILQHTAHNTRRHIVWSGTCPNTCPWHRLFYILWRRGEHIEGDAITLWSCAELYPELSHAATFNCSASWTTSY